MGGFPVLLFAPHVSSFDAHFAVHRKKGDFPSLSGSTTKNSPYFPVLSDAPVNTTTCLHFPTLWEKAKGEADTEGRRKPFNFPMKYAGKECDLHPPPPLLGHAPLHETLMKNAEKLRRRRRTRLSSFLSLSRGALSFLY